MCGIVGYCGPRMAKNILVEGLKRLEYRGYDSSGIAVGENDELTVFKKTGKLSSLTHILPENLNGNYGIGHTRWATHGTVTDNNAHPHIDASGKIAVVHNGIIENHSDLRVMLEKQGFIFRTETDTEVIVHLIASNYETSLEDALLKTLPLLKGTYGILCAHCGEPNRIIGARNGSPLVMGVGDGEMFLASDVSAIVAYTKQAVYFEDGEIIVIEPNSYRTTNFNNEEIIKAIDLIAWDLREVEKNGFANFMEKEIFEQPRTITRAFRGRLNKNDYSVRLDGLNIEAKDLGKIKRIKLISSGTSFFAAMTAAYMIKYASQIPCDAELAAEFQYSNPIVEPDTFYFVLSQSGETADTLFAMRELQRKGAQVAGVCNAVGSTIARESNGGFYIHAGPEVAVASTKAFTSTIASFVLFTVLIGRSNNMAKHEAYEILKELEEIPQKVEQILLSKDAIQDLAYKYSEAGDFLFLGRGGNYPIALEGALKLKEVSYVHAEGYSAAEMKHGPIALINEQFPTLIVAPNDRLREKNISSIQEIKARNGKVIAIATEGDHEIASMVDDTLFVPPANYLLTPLLTVIPLQLFAYYTALILQRDVDQPRNLAKSVTVE